MTRWTFGLTAILSLCASFTDAQDVPSPLFTVVMPGDLIHGAVLAPAEDVWQEIPASVMTVQLRDFDDDPMPNRLLRFALYDWQGIEGCACYSFDEDFSGWTDSFGELEKALLGGDSPHGVASAGAALEVYFNAQWFELRDICTTSINDCWWYDFHSPDYDGGDCNRTVDLSDLLKFSNEFNGIEPYYGHDYDNTFEVNVGDLVVFGHAFSQGNSCPP